MYARLHIYSVYRRFIGKTVGLLGYCLFSTTDTPFWAIVKSKVRTTSTHWDSYQHKWTFSWYMHVDSLGFWLNQPSLFIFNFTPCGSTWSSDTDVTHLDKDTESTKTWKSQELRLTVLCDSSHLWGTEELAAVCHRIVLQTAGVSWSKRGWKYLWCL